MTTVHASGFKNAVLEHPPSYFYPNKDLPLSKDKNLVAHKEPTWKSGRLNEKEAWIGRGGEWDYAIDKANNSRLGLGVDE